MNWFRRRWRRLAAAAVAGAAIAMAAPRFEKNQGRDLFEKRCSGCHALDQPKVGPALRGVFGRRAGADPGFSYSAGLKQARITWDGATLNRWLADPESVVPDTDMSFRMEDSGERSAIIAFLQETPSK